MVIASLNTLIFDIFPIKLLDPLWQINLIGRSLVIAAPLLVGLLIIHWASTLDKKNASLYSNAQRARTVAFWIALSLFIFIPLQFYAGAKLVGRMKNVDKDTISDIRVFVNRLRLTKSEQEMRSLAASIPNPPALPAKLEEPFAKVRDDWANRLTNQANQQEEEYIKKFNNTWQEYLRNSVRNAIQAGLYGFAFLAISQRPSRNDKLLESLTNYQQPSDL